MFLNVITIWPLLFELDVPFLYSLTLIHAHVTSLGEKPAWLPSHQSKGKGASKDKTKITVRKTIT